MQKHLANEEQSDLETKEQCEEDRATDTREAVVASRTMDEQTELSARLMAEIEEIIKEIEAKEKAIADLTTELAEATEVRKDENALYLKEKEVDEEAEATVADA